MFENLIIQNQYNNTNISALLNGIKKIKEKHILRVKNDVEKQFNIRESSGDVLDMWGRLLGFSRFIPITSENQAELFKNFNFYNRNFVKLKFYDFSDIAYSALDDESYKLVLQIIWQGRNTLSNLKDSNELTKAILGFNVVVSDKFNMEFVTYYFRDELPLWLSHILDNFDILPRPACVGQSFVSAIIRYFDFKRDSLEYNKKISSFYNSIFTNYKAVAILPFEISISTNNARPSYVLEKFNCRILAFELEKIDLELNEILESAYLYEFEPYTSSWDLVGDLVVDSSLQIENKNFKIEFEFKEKTEASIKLIIKAHYADSIADFNYYIFNTTNYTYERPLRVVILPPNLGNELNSKQMEILQNRNKAMFDSRDGMLGSITNLELFLQTSAEKTHEDKMKEAEEHNSFAEAISKAMGNIDATLQGNDLYKAFLKNCKDLLVELEKTQYIRQDIIDYFAYFLYTYIDYYESLIIPEPEPKPEPEPEPEPEPDVETYDFPERPDCARVQEVFNDYYTKNFYAYNPINITKSIFRHELNNKATSQEEQDFGYWFLTCGLPRIPGEIGNSQLEFKQKMLQGVEATIEELKGGIANVLSGHNDANASAVSQKIADMIKRCGGNEKKIVKLLALSFYKSSCNIRKQIEELERNDTTS